MQTLRRNDDSIAKQAIHSTLQGHSKRQRPKNTWKRDREKEMRTRGFRKFMYSWRKMEEENRSGWKQVDDASLAVTVQ